MNTLGNEHPEIASVQHGLGTLYERQKEFASAITCYSTALQMNEKAFGQYHPSNSLNCYKLGNCYRLQKRSSHTPQPIPIFLFSLFSFFLLKIPH